MSRQDHVEDCQYEDVKCPDPNCKIVIRRSQLENHIKKECQWRVVVCDYCEDKYAVCKEEVRSDFVDEITFSDTIKHGSTVKINLILF